MNWRESLQVVLVALTSTRIWLRRCRGSGFIFLQHLDGLATFSAVTFRKEWHLFYKFNKQICPKRNVDLCQNDLRCDYIEKKAYLWTCSPSTTFLQYCIYLVPTLTSGTWFGIGWCRFNEFFPLKFDQRMYLSVRNVPVS